MTYFETWPLPHDNIALQNAGQVALNCNLEDVSTINPDYQHTVENGAHFLDCTILYQQPMPPRPLSAIDLNSGQPFIVESVWVEFGSTFPQRPHK